MSVIALSWVATISVGNQTAKQLLQFYASHNFNTTNYVFKNSTLAKQLEVTERAIQKAHKFLMDGGFIKKDIRFNQDGRQMTNSIMLNIPPEFGDNFFGEGEQRSPLGANNVQGEGERSAPLLNNKLLNNKLNRESIPRTKREPLSENFKPDQEREAKAKAVAQRCNIPFEDLLSKFKTIEKKKNKTSTDWQADFELFLLREKPSVNKSAKESKPNPQAPLFGANET